MTCKTLGQSRQRGGSFIAANAIENGWSNAEIYPFHELDHENTDFVNVSFFLGKHQDPERTDDTEPKPRRCFARLFVIKDYPVCASVDGKGDCLAFSLMQAHGKKTGCGVRWQDGRNYEIRTAYGSSSWKTEYFIITAWGIRIVLKRRSRISRLSMARRAMRGEELLTMITGKTPTPPDHSFRDFCKRPIFLSYPH